TGLSSTIDWGFRNTTPWPGSFDSMKAFAMLGDGSAGLVQDPRFNGAMVCLGSGVSACFATP
ncbi:hypothetical protein, partial [Stenotrophomonas maltophilia]|uniref:hypothetical protein n=1 Tax=Stenotrophomonas maltophilia TaxID=40324 RepID=UPI0013DD1DFB